MNVSRYSHAMLVLCGVVAAGYGCDQSASPTVNGQGGTQAANQNGGAVAQNGGSVSQGGSPNNQGGNVVAQTGGAIAQGGNAVAQGGNVVSQTGGTVAQGGTAVAQGGNVVSQTGGTVAQGGSTAASGGNATTGGASNGGSSAGGAACVANGACVKGSANCTTSLGQTCLCSTANSTWSCSAAPAGGSSQGGASSTGGTKSGTGGAIVFNCTANAACTPAGSNCMTSTGVNCNCSSVNNTWSCAAVAATGGAASVGACASSTTHQNESNAKDTKIPLGRYYVINNQWGASSGSGTQSTWSTCNDGTNIGWGTSFNWSGGASSVKSYASAVLGWHWGWVLPISTSYMPIQVGSSKNLNCSWSYKVTRTGTVTMNVAYDLWIHTFALQGGSNEYDSTTYKPSDEIMIWLYSSNGAAPAGSTVGTYTLAGTSWALWKGTITDSSGAFMWNVYSFVRTANADTGMSLNIQEFLTKLKDLGHLTTSKYLSSVQAGTEIFTGQGTLDTLNYSCAP